jgi:hypothetical protein
VPTILPAVAQQRTLDIGLLASERKAAIRDSDSLLGANSLWHSLEPLDYRWLRTAKPVRLASPSSSKTSDEGSIPKEDTHLLIVVWAR